MKDCEYGETGQSIVLRFARRAWKRRIDIIQIRIRVERRELGDLALVMFVGFFGLGTSTFGYDEPV
jgi:hypothetical protein